MINTIFIWSDHWWVDAKKQLIEYLEEEYPQIKAINKWVDTTKSVDFPDIAREVCFEVLKVKNSIWFLICGTGQWMNIAAGKVNGIIPTLIHHPFVAKMAAAHNNFNLACFWAREWLFDNFKEYVDLLLTTKFQWSKTPKNEKEENYQRRVDKMTSIKYMNNLKIETPY